LILSDLEITGGYNKGRFRGGPSQNRGDGRGGHQPRGEYDDALTGGFTNSKQEVIINI
jgi:hypothetical protein